MVQGLIMFCFTKILHAQPLINTSNQNQTQEGRELSVKEQAIVTISALTAQDDIKKL